MAEILNTTWHGFAAIALESHLARVVMVPELGAKIVSLFDRTHQHEWLVPPMRTPQKIEYAASFISQDMSGWDEMLPTINACEVQGARLPDHGEVWSLPWTWEPGAREPGARETGAGAGADEVLLSVQGVAFPYHFSRSAALTAANVLRLRYRLVNQGQAAFPYLWAAHPQFAADRQTRLMLPLEVRELVNVIDDSPQWGQAGDRFAWPRAVTRDGQGWHLDRVRPAESHTCRKLYVPPEQPVGWAALSQEDTGCRLHMQWSARELPYLGMWVDEGMVNARPVAAFEPATAYYDSLAWAVRDGTAPSLPPGQAVEWEVLVQFQ